MGADLVGATGILISRLLSHRPVLLSLGYDSTADRSTLLRTIYKNHILRKNKYKMLYFLNLHYVYKNCHHFIVNSYYLRNLLHNNRHFKGKDIFVVPQAVRVNGDSTTKGTLNGDSCIRLLTVTNLTYRGKYEGVAELIDFITRYAQSVNLNNRFVFDIYGEGNYETHLKEKIKTTPGENNLSIRYLGFIENLEPIYKAAHIFLYCSLRDSLARVLLEAQGHGLPILVNDFEPFREVMRNGHNGLLYKAGDFEDFKRRFHMLVTDPALAHSLKKNCLKNVRKNYSIEAIGKRLNKVLSGIPRANTLSEKRL
jgi:glycosyltransferase involved in cell wall biosynthesis